MMKLPPATGAAAEVAAWWKLVELCLPSHEACGAATFQPAGVETLEADWDEWVRCVFRPVLRPALLSLQAAASTQDIRALLDGERRLGAALSAPAARGSLAAGRKVLSDCRAPLGARMLERLAVDAHDGAVGHLATVFSVRSHVFHLPSVQVGGAMLLAECVLGAGSVGVTLAASPTVDMLQRAADSMPVAPALQVLAV